MGNRGTAPRHARGSEEGVMTLRVTLDIFSGRPNPVVDIDAAQAGAILERVGPARRIGEGEDAWPIAPPLGYRGIVFEHVDETSEDDLPKTFRLIGGALFGLGLAHRVADDQLEQFLHGSTGPFAALDLEGDFFDRVAAEATRFEELRGTSGRPVRGFDLWNHGHPPHGDRDHDDDDEEHHGRERCRCAPLYEPAWWNDGGLRQDNNNCYNYSTNIRTDTFAQPGRAAGAQYAALTCPDVLAGAVADEVIAVPNAGNRCPHEGHLVALVVAPGFDFHWYRKGRDGLWTHKPGSTAATNVDNAGQPIPDPRAVDRGPYVDFCTFMVVKHGHVKIE